MAIGKRELLRKERTAQTNELNICDICNGTILPMVNSLEEIKTL